MPFNDKNKKELSKYEQEDAKKSLKNAMDKYKKTGSVDSITNEVNYLYSKGFSQDEIGEALQISQSELPDNPHIDGDMKKESKNIGQTSLQPSNILGLPFQYDAVTDPDQRVYIKTLFSDAPIVSIIPGKPQFAKTDSALKSIFTSSASRSPVGGDNEEGGTAPDTGEHNIFERELMNRFKFTSDSQIESFLKRNAGSQVDYRYYGFRSAYPEFSQHLDAIISTVGIKMGAVNGLYTWGDSFKKEFMKTGIRFYCLKSTSASESLDNSFGDSAIRDAMNGISGMAREFQFLTGIGKGGEYDTGDVNEELAKEMAEFGNKTRVIDKLTGALKGGVGMIKNAAMSGSNLNFPQVWKDSAFSRSYNLEFKFTSPYGHPKAIFEYVYLPMLVLMTLTMPKMDSLMGYYAPYLVRVDMPKRTGHVKLF